MKGASFAVGLVVGVGLALIFLVLAVPEFRHPPFRQIEQPNAPNNTQEREQSVEGLWDAYTTPEDTYAQWIAAFAALASVSVSIWAVWLVRNTLSTSRAGNEIVRQSGIAQLRAYVSIVHVNAELRPTDQPDYPYYLEVWVTAANGGVTPARRVQTLASLDYKTPDGRQEIIGMQYRALETTDISPDGKPYSIFHQKIGLPKNIAAPFAAKELTLALWGRVDYDPVVGPKQRHTPFKYRVNYAGPDAQLNSACDVMTDPTVDEPT